MKKIILATLLGAGVLSGCASNSPREIPVVEAGTRLSPGPLRDTGQLPPPVVKQQEPLVTVTTPPDSGLAAIASSALPAEPIQAEPTAALQPIGQVSSPAVTAGQEVASLPRAVEAPVQALLDTAQQQRSQGDLNGAASSLERALRIAPQEPQVLYRLSEIRLMQGDAAQAEQLAQQGLQYSGGRPALQAGLWDLISEARDKQGNRQGAEEAREKARVFM